MVLNIISTSFIIAFLVAILSWSFTMKDVIYNEYEFKEKSDKLTDKVVPLDSEVVFYPIESRKNQ